MILERGSHLLIILGRGRGESHLPVILERDSHLPIILGRGRERESSACDLGKGKGEGETSAGDTKGKIFSRQDVFPVALARRER